MAVVLKEEGRGLQLWGLISFESILNRKWNKNTTRSSRFFGLQTSAPAIRQPQQPSKALTWPSPSRKVPWVLPYRAAQRRLASPQPYHPKSTWSCLSLETKQGRAWWGSEREKWSLCSQKRTMRKKSTWERKAPVGDPLSVSHHTASATPPN